MSIKPVSFGGQEELGGQAAACVDDWLAGAGCGWAVASGTAKCLQKLAKWPNSFAGSNRWKLAE
jgi:hypothetical protein